MAHSGLFVAPAPGTPPVGTSPIDGRLVLGALFGTYGQCLTGGTISTSSSTMQVTVGQAVWQIPDPSNAAAVFHSPTDAATLTIGSAPGSGSRIDAVWVKQNDYENGDADSRANLGVTAGTAGSSPTVPAIPAGALLIATVTVPTGVSNTGACTVSAKTPTSVAPTDIVAASFSALQQVTGRTGQRGFVGTTEYRWNGSAWKLWAVPVTTYTPTLTGITIGNGTRSGVYWIAAGVLYGAVEVRWGSSTTMSGTTYVGLPLTVADLTYTCVGGGYADDATGGHTHVDVILDTTSRLILETSAAIGAGSPWTWASGDKFSIQFSARLP